MKTVKCVIASLILVLVSSVAGLAQDTGWPREHTANGNKLVIYQPQVDDWKNFTELEWRMAFELTPKGGKPAVGIAVMKAETLVDNDNKMVLITNISILETRFPSLAPATASQMDQLMRTFLPQSVSISLQRLVACVPKKDAALGMQLKNDPPVIFISYKPAILLDVDGQPVRVQIQNTGLEYVVNTHWPLFFDTQSSSFYLLAGEQWLTTQMLAGTWSSAKKLPQDMPALTKEPQWAELKNVMPLQPAKQVAAVPAVYYSTRPAEVILFDGKPVYAQIPGTRLEYATNTASYLFLYTATNQYYYLTAGRWFSSDSLGGPWTFATPNLPDDFTRIPRNSPAAQVLASVPGTEEARDAVLMAQIPTTVIVDPDAAAANAKVIYDGTPQFARVEGTTLSYATNTTQKVIRAGDLYYLCLQGIWFVSASPQGPWQTASSVPQVIYTIPPSSPVYNVTYVTQVTTSSGSVEASYTAGYMGVYAMGVATGVIIASGTGYYYPPYVAYYPGYRYPVYYPTPYTYGYGSYYHSSTGAYGVSQTAYGPYGSATRAASYNPYTGTYARGGSVSTAYGSASAGRAYNPYTGAYAQGASVSTASGSAAAGRAYDPATGTAAATRQGSNAYASWGSSAVSKGGQTAYTQHYSTTQGTAGSVQTSSGGRAAGVSTEYGSTAVGKTASGDMYAGHDGNVYKKTEDGWQKYDNGSWTSMQSSAQQQAQQRSSSLQQSGGGTQMQQLQQESQNRQRGQQSSQRFQDFQRSGGGSRSWGGSGGGSRSWGGGGGGGRGRR